MPWNLLKYARTFILLPTPLVFFGFVAFASEAAAAPPTMGEKATILQQEGTLSGRQTVYITPHAVRVDNKQRGVVTLATAPDWNVTIYNTGIKHYFVTPMTSYRGMMAHVFLFYGIDMTAYNFKLLRKDAVLGHQCLVLQAVAKNAKTPEDVELSANCKAYWVTDQVDAGKRGAELLARQMCLPQTQKIPLRMDYVTDNRAAHGLETVKWSTQEIPKDWFAVPAGYTKVSRESDVYSGGNLGE